MLLLSSPSDEGRLVRSMTSTADGGTCVGVTEGGLGTAVGGVKCSGVVGGGAFSVGGFKR